MYLFESLLEPGLFGNGQGTDCFPAVAKLLQLNFDPGGVIPACLHQLSGRPLQSLHTTGPFSQLFLEDLRNNK